MKKFPLIKRFGLKVDHKIVASFDQTEKKEVYTVSAEELEDLLQSGIKLYLTRNDNGFTHYRTDTKQKPNYSTIALPPNRILPPCEAHTPEDDTADVTTCKVCEETLFLEKKYVTKE